MSLVSETNPYHLCFLGIAHFAGQGIEAHESENPLNFESVRANWISKQLKLREASFTKTYDVTYVICAI